MATSISASALFPIPIHEVWTALRNFDFPAKLAPSVVQSVELSEKGTQHDIGTTRQVTWKSGETRKSRLIELSDQYHTMRWELIESNPPFEVSAVISCIRCRRVTETNQTLVEWSAEYSSDVSRELLQYEQKAFQDSLDEMRSILSREPTPILYHIHEAPSSRVVWLANELGIPLRIQAPQKKVSNLRMSSDTERSMVKGGLVTCYVEEGLTLLESGAILSFLIEKHDHHHRMIPSEQRERAYYYKYIFYTAATVDHILLDAYKLMYVVQQSPHSSRMHSEHMEVTNESETLLEDAKARWDEDVVPEYERQLRYRTYITGDTFSAADIMVGWTLYTASLLNWFDREQSPILTQYYDRLTKRPAFHKTFSRNTE
eukprot:TRINITY_DN351_c12_g1_i1.p1 TRINITY_DN351_c12_g1~~TRINITY_DN351_c12_g1_i1.p1  ORF type:complete len:373 (+),score=69.18 TRINITY_DN351_c12_g1_i1:174-1292(+)